MCRSVLWKRSIRYEEEWYHGESDLRLWTMKADGSFHCPETKIFL